MDSGGEGQTGTQQPHLSCQAVGSIAVAVHPALSKLS